PAATTRPKPKMPTIRSADSAPASSLMVDSRPLITPVACSTIHSTMKATMVAMPMATDMRNDIFITDHGSTAETVSRTVRGPFFLPCPLSNMFFTPIVSPPELARTVFPALVIAEVAVRSPPEDLPPPQPWEAVTWEPAPDPWEPVPAPWEPAEGARLGI